MKLLAARPSTLALAIVIAVMLLLVRSPVWIDTGIIIGIQALIALSVGLCYGQAGILSLAQASFAAVGAYVSGALCLHAGWHPGATLPLAIAVPALLGWLLTYLVIRMEPLAVALATIAIASVVEIVLRNWDAVTGGYIGLVGIAPVFEQASPHAYLALTWLVVWLVVWLYENLMRTRFGRALNTAHHDRARALADGVPVAPLLCAAFALSAGIAGAAGWLYAHHLGYLGPNDLGARLSIAVVLMAVVGGVGYVLGPVVGAIFLGVVLHVLPAEENQGLFLGIVLIAVLIFARKGLFGLRPPAGVLDAVARRLPWAGAGGAPGAKEGL